MNRHTPSTPPDDQDDRFPGTPRKAGARDPSGTHQVPRTRAGSAWVGLAVAATVAVALVVFMAQNTDSVDISFLWMTGRLSLGLTLLIAVLGSILVTMTLGTARILQLRHLIRRQLRSDEDQTGKPEGTDGPAS